MLIRDLGISRQFAFVHFYSVPDARAFLEQHYPTLNLGHSADRCRIAFSRERENDDRRGRRRDEGEEEWKCRVVSIPILDVRSVVAVVAVIVQRGERGTFRGVCFPDSVSATVSSSELPPATGMLPLSNTKDRFVPFALYFPSLTPFQRLLLLAL